MKENSNIKIAKFMKFMSKTKLNHLLLSITFNDNYCIEDLNLSILHLSIQHNNKSHHEKKSNLNNAFLLLLNLWPKILWF